MASSSGESREACVFWLMVHSCSCSAALLIRCFLAPLLKYVCAICLLLSVQVCQLFFCCCCCLCTFYLQFQVFCVSWVPFLPRRAAYSHSCCSKPCGKADLFVLPSVFMKTIESRGFYDTHVCKAVLNTDYEVCVFLIMLQAQTAGAQDK